MPNDEEEQDREGMLHDIFKKIFENRLTSTPLRNPTKILDIGTGTGEWAMDIGDVFPDAEVIGTDIAKIQPSAAPSNVFFQIDDAEDEDGWTWSENEFDLVHLRGMQGAFMDWRHIYTEAFRVLKKGGCIEILDFDNHTRLLSYFSDDPDVAAWLAAVNEASRRSGRPRGDAHLNPALLEEVGFVDVSVTEKIMPLGAWPEDEDEQNTGKHFLVTMLDGVEGTSLRLLTQNMGWKIEDVRKTIKFVETRMKAIAMDKHKSKGMGFIVKVLVGVKPSDEGIPEVDIPDEESVKTMTNLNGGIYADKW
jgi:SAM-dependent methyltransferase